MKNLYLTTSLAVFASPALADITPAELLESWQAAFDLIKMDIVIGAQAYEEGVLVLSDVQIMQRTPSSSPPSSMDWVRLSPLPDGTVSIEFSSLENTGSTMADPTDPQTLITTTSRYEDLAFIASGTPEKIIHTMSAGEFHFTQTHFSGPLQTRIAAVASGLSMRYSTWPDGSGNFNAEGQLDAESVNIKWANSANFTQTPGQRETLQVGALSFTNSSMPFEMVAPPSYFANLDAPITVLPEGLTMDFRVRAEATNLSMNGGDQAPDFTLDASLAESEIAITIGDTNLRYLFDFSALDVLLNTPELPGQALSVRLERLFLDIAIPFRKSSTAAPFAIAMQLKNAVLAPAVWDIFDPNAALARVPASVDIQTSGTASMLANFLNPEEAEALTGPPLRLHTFSLDHFEILAENARVTGEGNVTVDNDTMVEATGLPDVSGSLSFTLTGVLAALDRVGRLPGLDPMMAIGAKGALGMFATPNSDPDSLTSRIEFTDGGHISVNGQQVQ